MLRQMLISRSIEEERKSIGVANTKQVGPISVPQNDRDKGMGKSGARGRGNIFVQQGARSSWPRSVSAATLFQQHEELGGAFVHA